jgi:hypothetical protein
LLSKHRDRGQRHRWQHARRQDVRMWRLPVEHVQAVALYATHIVRMRCRHRTVSSLLEHVDTRDPPQPHVHSLLRIRPTDTTPTPLNRMFSDSLRLYLEFWLVHLSTSSSSSLLHSFSFRYLSGYTRRFRKLLTIEDSRLVRSFAWFR